MPLCAEVFVLYKAKIVSCVPLNSLYYPNTCQGERTVKAASVCDLDCPLTS